MNYNKLTKKELIERIELLENAVIGIEVFPRMEAVAVTADVRIKNMICSIPNKCFSNKNHIMFTVQTQIIR